ncbi:MAG TPA: TrkA family potassium uptake protein [Syntrophomonadaceae bacterium]|nr:TrkA family potassium uptake protein [Syntrophomonadaceae bacterium]
MKSKQFAVIGLGRFGCSLVNALSSMGHEVLAIDSSEDRVQEVADIATHAVEADSMDENILKALGIRNFDIVVVAIGENIQASILTTIILKELGVKKVVARAQTELHGKVLEKLGVDLVIYPERDMAIKLAQTLVSNNILELIALSPHYSLIELAAPVRFVGHTLEKIDLRKHFQVNILAIKRKEDIIVAPGPGEMIASHDLLVMIGKTEDLKSISNSDEG